MEPLIDNPQDYTAPHPPRPATPAAGFAPVTPVGDAALLSLVPPIQQGESIRHPDPISSSSGEQQPLPTSAQIPVAPVRRRRPVTPLISLPTNASLQAALQVAPIIPGQSLAPQPIATGPAAYGVQPTTFPFNAAPAFNYAPPAQNFMPQPLPMQMYVAFVTLMNQQPQFMPQQYQQPMQPYPPMPQQYAPQPYMQPQPYAPQPWPQQQYPQYPPPPPGYYPS
jgi:hypothetical protein